DALVDQAAAGHDQVDTQTALWIVLESPAAIIEPAETIIHLGVHMAEGIDQPPILEPLQPLPLFGQETALAGAQPALGVSLANSDITVLWRNVQIPHHHYPLIGRKLLFEMTLEIGIEPGLGR